TAISPPTPSTVFDPLSIVSPSTRNPKLLFVTVMPLRTTRLAILTGLVGVTVEFFTPGRLPRNTFASCGGTASMFQFSALNHEPLPAFQNQFCAKAGAAKPLAQASASAGARRGRETLRSGREPELRARSD